MKIYDLQIPPPRVFLGFLNAPYMLLRYHTKIQKCPQFSKMHIRTHPNTHPTHTILSDALLFGLFYFRDASPKVSCSYISIRQTHWYQIQRHVIFQIEIKIYKIKLGLYR